MLLLNEINELNSVLHRFSLSALKEQSKEGAGIRFTGAMVDVFCEENCTRFSVDQRKSIGCRRDGEELQVEGGKEGRERGCEMGGREGGKGEGV